MMVDSFEEWEKRTVKGSDIYCSRYISYKKYDVDGWEDRVWSLLMRDESVRPFGYFLEGVNGTGKHTALAFFLDAYKQLDYSIYYVPVRDLPSSPEECDLFADYLETLCSRDDQNTALVVDSIDNSECAEYLLDIISDYGSLRLNYVIISNKTLDTSSYFNNSSFRFEFGSITMDQKRRFMTKNASNLIDSIDIDMFVETVGTCTYGEIANITRCLSLYKESHGISHFSNDEIIDIVNKYVKSDCIDRFQLLSDRILDRLETIIMKIPSATVRNESLLETSDDSRETDLGNTSELRDKYYEMPPKELATELFGEEGVQDILDSVEYVIN
ncbi:MAG: hypothetical protein IJ869_07360 [Clostridiales bacterium]|nr:hypothetical protein [Clostridiales bacterium]